MFYVKQETNRSRGAVLALIKESERTIPLLPGAIFVVYLLNLLGHETSGGNMYKYVIFDVDGTMVDTEEAVMHSYQSVIFEKYGRHFSEEEMLKGYGVPTPKALAKYGF
ncbi:MAG: HAD hydrolase-like protein, partial [Ruminiclostridium sp.]